MHEIRPQPPDNIHISLPATMGIPKRERDILTWIVSESQFHGIVGDSQESSFLLGLIDISLRCEAKRGTDEYQELVQQRDNLMGTIPKMERSSEEFQNLLANFAVWHDRNFSQ